MIWVGGKECLKGIVVKLVNYRMNKIATFKKCFKIIQIFKLRNESCRSFQINNNYKSMSYMNKNLMEYQFCSAVDLVGNFSNTIAYRANFGKEYKVKLTTAFAIPANPSRNSRVTRINN